MADSREKAILLRDGADDPHREEEIRLGLYDRLEDGINEQAFDIDYDKLEITPKTNLYTEVYRRICNFVLPDIQIKVGGESFDCHLTVLQMYSGMFVKESHLNEQRYDGPSKVELPVDKVSVNAFIYIYDWMVCRDGKKLARREDVLEIYVAAKYLQVKDLIQQYQVYLESELLFNEETAFKLYLQAKLRNLMGIQKLMLPRVKSYFLKLVASDLYLELEWEDVCALLSSNNIRVNSELEVFYSALHWIKYDWQERLQHVVKLMEQVRFGLISSWHLLNMKRNKKHTDIIEILKHSVISQMVDTGLAYSLDKHYEDTSSEPYEKHKRRLKSRNLTGVKQNHQNYNDFKKYIKNLSLKHEEDQSTVSFGASFNTMNESVSNTITAISGGSKTTMETDSIGEFDQSNDLNSTGEEE